MDVEVKHGLPAVGVRVYHHTISVLGKALVACDLCRRQKQMAERLFLTIRRFVQRIEVLARNDQDMRRRLRAEVVKSDAHAVLKNLLRRYLAARYPAKDAIALSHNK